VFRMLADATRVRILWALIDAHDAGDGLTELEILHNCIFMLNAGHDTTTSLLSNGVDLLLRFPEQFERLRQEPALIRPAVEEMLRYESPLQIGNRRSLADGELGGQRCRSLDRLRCRQHRTGTGGIAGRHAATPLARSNGRTPSANQ